MNELLQHEVKTAFTYFQAISRKEGIVKEVKVNQLKLIILSQLEREQLKEWKKTRVHQLPAFTFGVFKDNLINIENCIETYGLFIDIDNKSENGKVNKEQIIEHLKEKNINFIIAESITSSEENPKYHLFLLFNKAFKYNPRINSKQFYRDMLDDIFKDCKIDYFFEEGNVDFAVSDIWTRRVFQSPKDAFYYEYFNGQYIEPLNYISINKIEQKSSTKQPLYQQNSHDKYFNPKCKKGNRNNHLAKSIGWFLNRCIKTNDKIILDMLEIIAQRWNESLENPMPTKEVLTTVNSIFNRWSTDETFNGYDKLTYFLDYYSKQDRAFDLETIFYDIDSSAYCILFKNGNMLLKKKVDFLDYFRIDLLENYCNQLPFNVYNKLAKDNKYVLNSMKGRYITFDPTRGNGIFRKDGQEYYNLFKKTKYMDLTSDKKMTPNDFKIINANIDNLCPDPEIKREFMNWIGYHFKTREKSRKAFVIYGGQGAGKNFFFKILEALYGKKQCYQASNTDITSKFNDVYENKLFVLFNEVNEKSGFSSANEIKNIIKTLITEETIRIERKGLPVVTKPNTFNCLFASNEELPVLLESTDRRFSVSRSADKKLDERLIELGLIKKGEDIMTKVIENNELENFAIYLNQMEFTEEDKVLYHTPIEHEEKRILMDRGESDYKVIIKALLEKDLKKLDEYIDLEMNYYKEGLGHNSILEFFAEFYLNNRMPMSFINFIIKKYYEDLKRKPPKKKSIIEYIKSLNYEKKVLKIGNKVHRGIELKPEHAIKGIEFIEETLTYEAHKKETNDKIIELEDDELPF